MGKGAPDEYQQAIGEVHGAPNGCPIGARHAQLEDHLLQEGSYHLAKAQQHSRHAQQ